MACLKYVRERADCRHMAEHQENAKKMQGKETLQLMAAAGDWTVETTTPKGSSWAFVSDIGNGHGRILPVWTCHRKTADLAQRTGNNLHMSLGGSGERLMDIRATVRSPEF